MNETDVLRELLLQVEELGDQLLVPRLLGRPLRERLHQVQHEPVDVDELVHDGLRCS